MGNSYQKTICLGRYGLSKRGSIVRVAARHGAVSARVFGSMACGKDDAENVLVERLPEQREYEEDA